MKSTKFTIGTDNSENPVLEAGELAAWLYVGRLSQRMTDQNIREYLQRRGIKQQDITCEELRTMGTNKSFKVGIPYQFLEQVEEPSYWPQGVLVRPFRAPRRRYQGADIY